MTILPDIPAGIIGRFHARGDMRELTRTEIVSASGAETSFVAAFRPVSAIPHLVPSMAEQRQDNNEPVEELDVEAAEPAATTPVWMNATVSAPMAPPTTVPTPPQVGVPPTNTEARTGNSIRPQRSATR